MQAARIKAGIAAHGIVHRPELGGDVYAYEVDGYGNALLMDDANVPSLLSLPYLGFVKATDPVYARTRAYVLSNATNPWFFEGRAGEGVGGLKLIDANMGLSCEPYEERDRPGLFWCGWRGAFVRSFRWAIRGSCDRVVSCLW